MARVPLASNGLTDEQIEDAISVLRSGRLTMGSAVAEFENKMADYLGVEHFVMVNSGSSANLAIVESLLRPTHGSAWLSPGDEVLVPAIAWPTTIWPLLQLGLKPRFVDISSHTLALDLDHAQNLIDDNPRVRGIFPIHPLGYGIPSNELEAFAGSNRLLLINDVCESLGSWRGNRHAGIAGFAASFSFYFSHHITTMEGGGVATNSAQIADDLRSIRSHGWSRDRSDHDQWHSEMNATDRKFTFVSAGYNIRPMEIQAAIGISEIPKIDTYVERRREVAKEVWHTLKTTGLEVIGSESLDSEEPRAHSWMHIPIRISSAEFDRSTLLAELESRGVETRPVLTGNFLHQPSADRYLTGQEPADFFANADAVSRNSFLVGCHHSLTNEQIDYLAFSLREAAELSQK